MSSKEIQDRIREINIRVQNIKNDIQTYDKTIETCRNKIKVIEGSKDSRIAQARESDRKAGLNAMLSDYVIDQSDTNNSILNAEKDLADFENSIDVDDIHRKYMLNNGIPEDLSTRLKEVREEAEDVLSVRIVSSYFRLLGPLMTDDDGFLYAISSLTDVSDRLYNIRDNPVNMRLQAFINSFNNSKFSSNPKNAVLWAVMALQFLILITFSSLAMVAFLLWLMIYNFIVGFYIRDCLFLLKVVADNLDVKTGIFYEKALKDREDEIKEYRVGYDAKRDVLEKRLLELANTIEVKTQEFDKAFVFNDSKVLTSIRNDIKNSEDEIAKTSDEKSEAEAEQRDLENKIQLLHKKLKEELASESIKFTNLNATGTSKIYPEVLLFNKNEETGVLKMFENVDKSTLFIYDDNDTRTLESFINMFIMQLRITTNPTVIDICVADSYAHGAMYSHFGDASTHFFRLTNDSDIKKKLEDCRSELETRISRFSGSYDSVNKFNEEMIAGESIPLDYTSMFILNPSILDSKEWISLMKIGAMHGIYLYVFATATEASSIVDDKSLVLTNIQNIRVLTDTTLLNMAPEKMIRTYGANTKNSRSRQR